MVSSLQSLSPSTAPRTALPVQTQGSRTEVDNLDFAIAYNLPPNYIQEGAQEQGYRSKFPTCTGTMSITDHDVKRTRAAS